VPAPPPGGGPSGGLQGRLHLPRNERPSPPPPGGGPRRANKPPPRRPAGASSPSPQRERSSPPPGQPAIGGTRGVPVTPASPDGGRQSRGQPARAPPRTPGGSRGDRTCPPPPRGGAKRRPAGASSPSPQRDKFSLMEAAQRPRRYQTAGEPTRTKPALRWRHHPSPPRPAPAASSFPAAPCAGGPIFPRCAQRQRTHSA